MVKSEKRLVYYFKLVSISQMLISPDWLNRIKHNVADILYDIRYTFLDFFGTIYNGFHVPWLLHIIIIVVVSVLKMARGVAAIKAPYNRHQINAAYEACKWKLNCPSGQVYTYPTIRPDSSRQRCRRLSTSLRTGKAKKWKHRISHQSR